MIFSYHTHRRHWNSISTYCHTIIKNIPWDFWRAFWKRLLVITPSPFLLENTSDKQNRVTLDPDYIQKAWFFLFYLFINVFFCGWLPRRRSRKLVRVIKNECFNEPLRRHPPQYTGEDCLTQGGVSKKLKKFSSGVISRSRFSTEKASKKLIGDDMKIQQGELTNTRLT